jgi:hypothetical protein
MRLAGRYRPCCEIHIALAPAAVSATIASRRFESGPLLRNRCLRHRRVFETVSDNLRDETRGPQQPSGLHPLHDGFTQPEHVNGKLYRDGYRHDLDPAPPIDPGAYLYLITVVGYWQCPSCNLRSRNDPLLMEAGTFDRSSMCPDMVPPSPVFERRPEGRESLTRRSPISSGDGPRPGRPPGYGTTSVPPRSSPH